MTITIVGLGPGDAGLITRQAWHLLSTIDTVYLRTHRHPAVAGLPAHLTLKSFDAIYDTSKDFGSVYETIATEVLRLAEKGDVVYAVPGNPFVGESTVAAIRAGAIDRGQSVRVVAGLSFVEPGLTALGIDALDGLQLFDAIEIASYLYPPINPDVPVMFGQVYSRFLAGELKAALMSIYPAEHPAVLIHQAGLADEVVERIALFEIDRSEKIDHLTSLYLPALAAKGSLNTLAETVAYLRGANGCPWDQEQTPASMREGLLEEAYEVISAIDADDTGNWREELGDLLYHIVMQAQMAAEGGDFSLTDVIAGIEAKLKRRHPHVWGDWQVNTTAEVLRNWEALKREEKQNASAAIPAPILANIPPALPALARSQKIQSKTAGTGFDWPDIDGVFDKLVEEIAEVRAAVTAAEKNLELGDVLFVVVNLARWLGVDAETALREANERFMRRFRQVEAYVVERGLDWERLSFAEMDALWVEAKGRLAENDGTDKV
jgi:tetrapyrrole methylase family protein/MazG family protein